MGCWMAGMLDLTSGSLAASTPLKLRLLLGSAIEHEEHLFIADDTAALWLLHWVQRVTATMSSARRSRRA